MIGGGWHGLNDRIALGTGCFVDSLIGAVDTVLEQAHDPVSAPSQAAPPASTPPFIRLLAMETIAVSIILRQRAVGGIRNFGVVLPISLSAMNTSNIQTNSLKIRWRLRRVWDCGTIFRLIGCTNGQASLVLPQ